MKMFSMHENFGCIDFQRTDKIEERTFFFFHLCSKDNWKSNGFSKMCIVGKLSIKVVVKEIKGILEIKLH